MYSIHLQEDRCSGRGGGSRAGVWNTFGGRVGRICPGEKRGRANSGSQSLRTRGLPGGQRTSWAPNGFRTWRTVTPGGRVGAAPPVRLLRPWPDHFFSIMAVAVN